VIGDRAVFHAFAKATKVVESVIDDGERKGT